MHDTLLCVLSCHYTITAPVFQDRVCFPGNMARISPVPFLVQVTHYPAGRWRGIPAPQKGNPLPNFGKRRARFPVFYPVNISAAMRRAKAGLLLP